MKKVILFTVLLMNIYTLKAQEAAESVKGKESLISADVAPANVKSLDGKTVNTNTFSNEGKPFIIDFWATWCKPCVSELSAIAENYSDWQSETGVKIFAISIDDARTMASVAPFVAGKNWDYEVYLDPNSDFRRAMNVNNVPHTFLFDGNGKIVAQHNTYAPGDEEKLYEELQKLVKK